MEQIVILDFGSQYTQVIARRVRECHVYSEIVPFHTQAAAIRALNPSGIILSGGPNSVHVEGAPRLPAGFFEYVAQVRAPQGPSASALTRRYTVRQEPALAHPGAPVWQWLP